MVACELAVRVRYSARMPAVPPTIPNPKAACGHALRSVTRMVRQGGAYNPLTSVILVENNLGVSCKQGRT